MKLRGIIYVDFDVETMAEAHQAEVTLETLMHEIARQRSCVVHCDFVLRERRGDHRPDLKRAKLRSG